MMTIAMKTDVLFVFIKAFTLTETMLVLKTKKRINEDIFLRPIHHHCFCSSSKTIVHSLVLAVLRFPLHPRLSVSSLIIFY